MITELTKDEVELIAGGLFPATGVGGFRTTSSTSDARSFVLARDRFLRRNPTLTEMDFGFPNLP